VEEAPVSDSSGCSLEPAESNMHSSMCHALRQALLMQADKEESHMLVWPNSEKLSAHKSKKLATNPKIFFKGRNQNTLCKLYQVLA
jgi:hypothetical protein